ncbi:HNH endonuclease [Paeniglutamicibacter sp. ABSL32-1]|uniref:HNH endonuclease signature motif containing protein n=1 Tax=Paeniglutamicibacter quisquiliarum TaxID=2849498 RepID=UPI001C2D00F5|nr:HNH endonuclease [Paeniglutamicibacter quisquiliarum]
MVTRRAEAAEIHRLDPVLAQKIDELVAHPEELANGTSGIPPEQLRPGMAPHRNILAYMQAHLHISSGDGRRRITGAKLLVASTGSADDNGETPAAPSYPILARAAADGSADVGNLASVAGRLESMQPRISSRPDAGKVNNAIEESLVHEARNGEPKMCGKALQDWGSFLAENGTPISDEEIRAKRGFFYQGFRDGSDEYLLRCDPMDSEVILAFGEAWTNPRSLKSPPFSASTNPDLPASGPEEAVPDIEDVSASGTPTFSPAGAPAPEWARPAGVAAEGMPLSELACGLPPEGSGLAGLLAQDPRTSPQRLLDALVAACSGALNGTGISETGGMRVKIGVLIGYRSLLGQCEDAGLTAHNRPVSAANIRRFACNGDILPAVMGEKGEVLDLGREVRGFSKAQRKAIAIRDRGCIVPGCTRPASTSECHHVIPWLEGGETSVENSALLCEYHHIQVHAGLITLKSIDGVPYVIAIDGQPRGAPQRNLYWHPELRTIGFTAPLFD